MSYLYRLSGAAKAKNNALSVPRGGMGTVSTAIAASARANGAQIRTDAPVARILVDGDKVSGVELEDGETIAADVVISNLDPKKTFFVLVGAGNLEAEFANRIHHIRMRGDAAKLHLALDGTPTFTGLDQKDLGCRLLIAPSLGHVERAFDHSKYGEYSEAPVMEITIPTVHDPTLAPSGKHVLSAIVQYAPYRLKAGWDSSRDRFAEHAIDSLARYAPDIRERIAGKELLTPVDIEREFGITGGHWHHGELALDQFLMLRPVPGVAQYAAPIGGLYLCGAGCHPGGGVMGLAGRNAAHEVMSKTA